MKNELTTIHGSLFPSSMKIFGFILCISIILLPIGILIIFANEGAQFKPNQKLYRHYSGVWGLNFGKWKSYEAYTDMALLSQRMSASGYSRGNVKLTQTEVMHELYLLTPDHRKKLLAYVFENKDAADNANPHTLADGLGVKFRTFSPKISAQTLARRRR